MSRRYDIYYDIVAQASAQPFEYGRNDCVLLVAEAVKRLTGIDYAAAFKPYDIRTAMRIIDNAGGYRALISRFIGPPAESLEGIRVCDPVLLYHDDVEACGLWSGSHPTVLGGEGCRAVDPAWVVASWRVG